MKRTVWFRIAGWLAAAGAAVTAGAALYIAVRAAMGLAGWARYPFDLRIDVESAATICQPEEISAPESLCTTSVVTGDPRVHGVGVALRGPMRLMVEPGWSPLIASLFLLLVVGLLATAFVLYQIFRLLRAAASGTPFSRTAVRRIAAIGWTVTGTELVLFALSQLTHPSKYLDFESHGPLFLAVADARGFDVTAVLGGLFVVLLAEVVRHGAALEEEARLTV